MKTTHTRGIALILVLATVAISATVAPALTARVTWTANTEPDLEGYGVYFRVDGGEWGHFRDISAAGMTRVDGVTGRWFRAPDTGRVYELVITAYDTSGNRSGASHVITIDTFNRTVSVREEEITSGTLERRNL